MSTLPGSPAAIVANWSVPVSFGELAWYGIEALPAGVPPPSSHVVPPLGDQITYMWYEQLASVMGPVPAVDSAAHVAALADGVFALSVRGCGVWESNAKYGLPWSSIVNAAKGVEASWPTPMSIATWGVHVAPLSSDKATRRLWNDWPMERLQSLVF